MSSINGGWSREAVEALASASDRLAARDLDALDDARLRADVATLTRVVAQATAERLRCVAEVARRGEDPSAGLEAARLLLRTAARLSGGQAVRQVRLAAALARPELSVTAAALAAGRISPGQAEALARAAGSHPDLVASAQGELVELAAGMDDRAFREVLADRRHAADPEPEEQEACDQYAARRLVVSARDDGMTELEGLLDPVGGALVRSALDALAGPDPATLPDEERRTPEQRNADALVQLARSALAHKDDLPTVAGLQPRATVFLTPETLAGEPGAAAAQLDWVGRICGATARLIACDADVVRRKITLNGRTVWLDIRRHPSPAQRLAVIERDRTCRFTTPDGVHCERPWQWSDIHHVEHHGHGGPTLTPNLALMCAHHHHAVHEGGWTVTGNADAVLTFHPPPDPPRRPRRRRAAGSNRPPPRPDRRRRERGRRDRDPPQRVLTG